MPRYWLSVIILKKKNGIPCPCPAEIFSSGLIAAAVGAEFLYEFNSGSRVLMATVTLQNSARSDVSVYETLCKQC